MTGNERRSKIYVMLKKSEEPLAARALAKELGVSRQIIVSDIALMRAEKHNIISTCRGYVLQEDMKEKRVFKVIHTDEQVADEMNTIVDFGGAIEDVFVYHKLYGTVRADMNIRSRKDVETFLDNLKTGKSSLLKNITSGYHYHTVSAPTDLILDLIQKQLESKGYLAKLQDYEPVDFWKKEESEENN